MIFGCLGALAAMILVCTVYITVKLCQSLKKKGRRESNEVNMWIKYLKVKSRF